MMRKSGPGLEVICQSRLRKGGKLVASHEDIGPAIPPFLKCDVLGVCTPEVSIKWIETDDNITPPALIAEQSMTFCDAGGGAIMALTSGQSPGEALTREEEIERVMEFLRFLTSMGDMQGGWQTRPLTESELRQMATDYVDVMRAISATRDGNGFVDFSSGAVDVEILNALARLSAGAPGLDLSILAATNAVNQAQDQMGRGPGWPYVDGQTILHIMLGNVVPNSAALNLLMVGGTVVALSAPIWGPAAARLVTTGATSAMPYMYAWLIAFNMLKPKVQETISYGVALGLEELRTNENANPRSVATAIGSGAVKYFGGDSDAVKWLLKQLEDLVERVLGLEDGGASTPEN